MAVPFFASDFFSLVFLASVFLLGVHIQTAVHWASHTRRDWTAYIAEREKVSTPVPRGNRTIRINALRQ